MGVKSVMKRVHEVKGEVAAVAIHILLRQNASITAEIILKLSLFDAILQTYLGRFNGDQ